MKFALLFLAMVIGWITAEFVLGLAKFLGEGIADGVSLLADRIAAGLLWIWERIDGALEGALRDDILTCAACGEAVDRRNALRVCEVCDREYDEAVAEAYGQRPPLLQDGRSPRRRRPATLSTRRCAAATCDRGKQAAASAWPGVWRCSRLANHSGPCALHPVDETAQSIYGAGHQ
jgi:hypothetical protein